ncbi:hypothetical protein V495_03680 [Pseudogymnoascus sp. VKM F-4514 (FW-929)]|nr:hypothetical protein V495_03680 [Pseudogymnoascus sp. VKM F-4514 (FW-929)]KFY54987.1 hypothetical protein V497_07297 [Pseudogymnoascus sp. VKM F-4516 (FW-969)]
MRPDAKEPKRGRRMAAGRILLTVSAVGQILGPFIADFNHTHVLNPLWPGHARFHNGQTMSMGLGLGLCTIYYTYRARLGAKPSGAQETSDSAERKWNAALASREKERDDLFTAALFGSLYWITGFSAILYPGSLGVDIEFGEGFPQKWIFGPLLICAWLGYWIGKR